MPPSLLTAAPPTRTDGWNRWHWRAIPCRELPELEAWSAQPLIRAALLREATADADAFVARAAALLTQYLLQQPLSLDSAPGPLSRLLAYGYTHEQIARAFVIAWLTDDPLLHLPRRHPVEVRWLAHGIPWLAAMATVSLLTLFELETHPDTVVALFFLSSFLAVPLLLLGWGYGRAWRWLLRRLVRAASAPSVSERRP